MFVLARACSFWLNLFYAKVIHLCVCVYVRAVMCAQFCMIPFYTMVCAYAYVCVCVCFVLVRAHRFSMIYNQVMHVCSLYNKVIHMYVCLHVSVSMFAHACSFP